MNYKAGGKGDDTNKHQKENIEPADNNIRLKDQMIVVMGFIPERTKNNITKNIDKQIRKNLVE
jgi:hypothetical protein